MAKWIVVSSLILISAHALAQDQYNGSGCIGDYRCGFERITEFDSRPRPRIVQPLGNTLQSPCDGTIKPEASYRAVIHSVTCGEGGVGKERLPIAVEKEVMDDWDRMSRSGEAQAQTLMQQIRQVDLSWSGEIEYPMTESWTYDRLTGDFAARCGYEPWQTICAKDREKEEVYYTNETDYDNCENWVTDPEPSYGSYGTGGDSNPFSGGSGFGSGSGSNGFEGGFGSHVGGASDRHPDSESKPIRRDPSGQRCTSYGTKKVRHTRWVHAGVVTYACMKQRPRWCTWFEPTTVSRACKNHLAKFKVEYKKNSEWKPGYTHASDRARDYSDLLPNKFDLLPGESEKIGIYSNLGSGSYMVPNIAFDSKWNEYTIKVTPQQVACAYNMKPEFKFEITTIGRKKAKSPNVLARPRDLSGKEMDPFDNEGKPLSELPMKMQLQDASRATMLQASMQSRTFPRPEAAIERDQKALFKSLPATEKFGTALSMGFWLDTQFKIQLFRYDKWGRMVKMTPENKFSEKSVDTFNDYITVGLDNGRLPNDFYRGTGPLRHVFGWAWRAFGVELSPGAKYVMMVQTSQRGLPFYESGCSNGQDACENEIAEDSAFGEPIRIEFEASKDTDRSFIRWFKDWVETRAIF